MNPGQPVLATHEKNAAKGYCSYCGLACSPEIQFFNIEINGKGLVHVLHKDCVKAIAVTYRMNGVTAQASASSSLWRSAMTEADNEKYVVERYFKDKSLQAP